jgi:glycerol dehydrogenase-like iron-containing ADH family enzyme
MQMADIQVLERVKTNILQNWDQIQEIAALVPTADQFRAWFKKIGAPITAQEIEITEKQTRIARDYGHYLRERFSINNIRHLFGWD